MTKLDWLSVMFVAAAGCNFVSAAGPDVRPDDPSIDRRPDAISVMLAPATGDPLWCEYFGAMNTDRLDYWMAAQVVGTPPGVFAAAFSYEIAAAYYAQHSNKQQALLDLIELADYQQIFVSSDYSGQLHELCAN